MQGLICKYSFDEAYFKVGDAFRLHEEIKVNLYVNAILDSVSEDELVFIVKSTSSYPDGIIKIDLDSVHSWEIIKLIPDYECGRFCDEDY